MIRDNNAFLMAMGEGSRIEIHAADAAKESWTQLSQTVKKGQDTLTVADSTGWEVGDKIAVASSGFDSDEAEEFTILSISADGKTIKLDRPVQNEHFGEIQTYSNGLTGADAKTWEVDTRAEVALLSRNVTIQGDEDSAQDGYGGHMMIMMGADIHISGAELTNMGQAGELGRYPIHFHFLDDASGQYVENVSIHHTFNKGLTIHGTDNLWIEDNVVFETIGHGYFFEDGTERGNVLVDNLSFENKAAPSIREATIASDATAVSSFWVRNPDNHFVGNHAAGSDHSGFWFLGESNVVGESATMAKWRGYNPLSETVGVFDGNTGHSNVVSHLTFGFRVDETTGKREFKEFFQFRDGFKYQESHVINDFTGYKSEDVGVWMRGGVQTMRDSALLDNHRSNFSFGSHVIEDTLIVGQSDNEVGDLGKGQFGHAWYDFPPVLRGVHFDGFEGRDDFAIVNSGGSIKSVQNTLESYTFGNEVGENNKYTLGSHQNPVGGQNNQRGEGFANGFVDLQGDIAGQKGATIIQRMDIDSPGGAVIRKPGFHNLAEARIDVAKNAVIVPESVDVVRFNLKSSEGKFAPFSVSRSDNGAEIYNAPISTGVPLYQNLGFANKGIVYEYDFDRMPKTVDMSTLDMERGSVITFKFNDVPRNAIVQNADQVYNFGQLNNANGTAWLRQGNDVYVKAVGENRITSNDPRKPQDFQENVWGDEFKIITRDFGNAKSSGNVVRNKWNSGGVVEEKEIDLPDRAKSTSNTVDITANDERWSDNSLWGGRDPGLNDIVVIRKGERVVLDEDVQVKGILIAGGELIVEDVKDLKLSADWILVNNGGLFQVGTEDKPHVNNFDLVLEGDDKGNDVNAMALVNSNAPNVIKVANGRGDVGGNPNPVQPPVDATPPVEPTPPADPVPAPTPPAPAPTPTPPAANEAPSAQDDAAATGQNQTIFVNVLANDSDPEGGALTLTDVSYSGNGAIVTIENNQIKVNPLSAVQTARTEEITYTVTDDKGATSQATLLVDIGGGAPTPAPAPAPMPEPTPTPEPQPEPNQAPVAQDDVAKTGQNQTIAVDVLANDSDPEGGALTLTDISYSGNSSIVTIVDNQIRVNPLSAVRTDRTEEIKYTVTDAEGATSQATLRVDIGNVAPPPPPNQAPVANDDTIATAHDEAVTVDVLANDRDPDGSTLELVNVEYSGSTSQVSIVNGQVVVDPLSGATNGRTEVITYTVADADGATTQGQLRVEVAPKPVNQAPVAKSDTFETGYDETITVNVLGNDTDPEGGALELVSVDYNGSTAMVSIVDGQVMVNPLSSATNARTEVITYTVADADGATAQGELRVDVAAREVPNRAPTAQDDVAQTGQDQTILVDVLANDSDPEGAALTLTDVSYSGNTSIVSIVNGQISVNPLKWATNARTEVIEYTVTDDKGLTDTGTLRVEIGEDSAFEVFLVNASNNQRLGQIDQGDVINSSNLNLGALSLEVVPDDPRVDSIFMSLDGRTAVESYVPYALFGDNSVDLNGGFISNGDHTLTLRGYSENGARGTLIDEEELNFTLSPTSGLDPFAWDLAG